MHNTPTDWRSWITLAYAARSHELRPVFRRGATAKQLAELERRLEARLPLALRELLAETNGVSEAMMLGGDWVPTSDQVWTCAQIARENATASTQEALADPPRQSGLRVVFASGRRRDGVRLSYRLRASA